MDSEKAKTLSVSTRSCNLVRLGGTPSIVSGPFPIDLMPRSAVVQSWLLSCFHFVVQFICPVPSVQTNMCKLRFCQVLSVFWNNLHRINQTAGNSKCQIVGRDGRPKQEKRKLYFCVSDFFCYWLFSYKSKYQRKLECANLTDQLSRFWEQQRMCCSVGPHTPAWEQVGTHKNRQHSVAKVGNSTRSNKSLYYARTQCAFVRENPEETM